MTVNWYKQKVTLAADRAIDWEAVAFRMLAHAQNNIRENDQIDTGFLLNSGYIILPDKSTYADTWEDGDYSVFFSETKDRKKAPELDLPATAKGAVVFGAEYAIYQEIQNSFLFKAAEQTAGEIGGLVKGL